MKLAVAVLVVMLAVVLAFHENQGQGGNRGNSGDRRSGSGSLRGGRNSGSREDRMGGSRRFNLCQSPKRFPPYMNNASIEQVETLWSNYQASLNQSSNNQAMNCSDILQQQDDIFEAAFDQYITEQAANLTAPARDIFNLFKQANDAYEDATPAVQKELDEFFLQVLMSGLEPGHKGSGRGRHGRIH